MVSAVVKRFLASFKDFNILRGFAVDGIFLLIMIVALFFFGNELNTRAMAVQQMAGGNLETMLATGSAEAAQVLNSLQSVLILSLIGLIVIVVGGLFLFSYTRQYLWNSILKKNSQYWRWNSLNLLMPLLVAITIVVLVPIRLLLSYILPVFSIELLTQELTAIVNYLILLIPVILVFILYHNFTRSYKVWESVGNVFAVIRKRWSKLWRMYLLIVLVAVPITLMQYGLSKILFNPTIFLVLNYTLSLLYIAWMRVYTIRTIE